MITDSGDDGAAATAAHPPDEEASADGGSAAAGYTRPSFGKRVFGDDPQYGKIAATWIGVTIVYAALTALGSVSGWLRILTVALTALIFFVAWVQCFLITYDLEMWRDDLDDPHIFSHLSTAVLIGTLVAGVGIGLWLT
ncbi:hypothetical protein [Melissospora conviva]|uniref:hypothetical protein n=1 Tax=Melissospora conviva TaxID=3388432 RepID=UPI003C1C02FD